MAAGERWNFVRSNLRACELIHNWTRAHGYVGENFTICAVEFDAIYVKIANGHQIPVSKSDFDFVFERWDGYISGAILRKTFQAIMTSKYVISILHALE